MEKKTISKNAKNKGMCLFYDWYGPLSMLPPEDFKELVLAMLDCRMTGKEPPSFENETSKIVASFIFPQIERSRVMSELGAKGGRESAERRKSSEASTEASTEAPTVASTKAPSKASTQDKTKQDKTKQDKTKQDMRQDVTVHKGDTSAIGCAESGEADTDGGKNADYDSRFKRFWQSYPRHVGKSTAREAFLRLAPSEELTEKIIATVSAQRGSPQWQREGGRFIPNPTTYIAQARWEDELCAEAGVLGTGRGGGTVNAPKTSDVSGRTAFLNTLPENAEMSGSDFEEWFEAKLLKNFGP